LPACRINSSRRARGANLYGEFINQRFYRRLRFFKMFALGSGVREQEFGNRSSGVQELQELQELQEFRSCRSCRSAGVQECRSSGVQECRSAGVQECRSTGVQEYRSTGVQNLGNRRELLTLVLQYSDTPVFRHS
jgi:hypothetical protein